MRAQESHLTKFLSLPPPAVPPPGWLSLPLPCVWGGFHRQVADVSHPMKPWHLHERWTRLITGEGGAEKKGGGEQVAVCCLFRGVFEDDSVSFRYAVQ